MMRIAAWLAGFVIVAIVIAAFAPASLLGAEVQRATRGEVRLAQAQGTVWNGRARLTDREGRASVPIAWRIDPLSLLRGTFRVDLLDAAAGRGVRGRVSIDDDALHATDFEAVVPAAALRLPAGLTAGGELRVSSASLAVDGDRGDGTLRLEWLRPRLASQGVGAIDLGVVTATLAADGARWRGPLEARGGVLVVDGEVIVERNGAVIALAIVPQAGAPEALRRWLGPADAGGTVRWRATPRWR